MNKSTDTQRKTPLKTKMLIGLVSLVLSLILLEAGLRVAGYFISSQRREAKVIAKLGEADSEAIRVLCVGDSFTWGGRGKRSESYPARLAEILKEAYKDREFAVINYGACETNSNTLRSKLPNWLDKFRPHVVVALVGSANRFNPWQSDGGSALASFVRSLRVVKMFRIMAVNARALAAAHSGIGPVQDENYYPHTRFDEHRDYLKEFGSIQSKDPYDDLLTELWRLHNSKQSDEALKKGLVAMQSGRADDEDILSAVAHFYYQQDKFDEAEGLLKSAAQRNPNSLKIGDALSYLYHETAKAYATRMQFEEAIKYCLKAIAYDPTEHYNYYRMTKIYDLQSHYDSRGILKQLEQIAKRNPKIRRGKWFSAYLQIYSDKEGWEKKVNESLQVDLDTMWEECENRGIPLILQNYPINYTMANNVLADIAKKHQLLFVDNLTVFDDLLPKNLYILDDDHCTATGHEIMAKNVFTALIRELGL